MIRRPPRSTRTDTLFPYTTLFRTRVVEARPGYFSFQGLSAIRRDVPKRMNAAPHWPSPHIENPVGRPLETLLHRTISKPSSRQMGLDRVPTDALFRFRTFHFVLWMWEERQVGKECVMTGRV